MTSPVPPGDGCAGLRDARSVEPVCLTVLRKRADFLCAARARFQRANGLLLQARQRLPGEARGIRVGYTCSRKVGSAVARNRAKRRLRAVAQQSLPTLGKEGWDYVLIGRAHV
ncbi:MAG: ribonuclease P protein component, partial [Rhodobacteraceae bacterium]|nr:ribonuclease P protein component [Paracoccaceae bacterium]